jgi:hypothetical protein
MITLLKIAGFCVAGTRITVASITTVYVLAML